jgi:hypothetical protein
MMKLVLAQQIGRVAERIIGRDGNQFGGHDLFDNHGIYPRPAISDFACFTLGYHSTNFGP